MKTTGGTTGKNHIKIMEIINKQTTKTIIMMAFRTGKQTANDDSQVTQESNTIRESFYSQI